MSFPNFSNFKQYIKDELKLRKDATLKISNLNSWIKITSGNDEGLSMVSNPNHKLFKAAGQTSGIYGDSKSSGTIGTNWAGNDVNSGTGQGFKPSPIVSSMEVDEGSGTLSRKASFTITAFTKEQMETIAGYFLEPGYSVFLEWGWNTPTGVGGIVGTTKEEISAYQSSYNRNKLRESTEGDYDNYLGFITGGSIALDGDKWNINVKCTGYTELPAYLLTSENGNKKGKANTTKSIIGKPFGSGYIDDNDGDLGLQRWMKVYNALPKTRQTVLVKNLSTKATGEDTSIKDEITDTRSYINFDEEVKAKINSNSSSYVWGFFKADVKVDGETVELTNGTKLVSDVRFIKFSTLMLIFNEIGIKGYTLGGNKKKVIKLKVNTSDTVCVAFPKIFSLNGDRLFIPNSNAPKLSLNNITGESTIQDIIGPEYIATPQIAAGGSDTTHAFPQTKDGKTQPDPEADPIALTAGLYGKLDDLYVNFDFAKGIMNTENFFVKDALYQLLNGLSSAVNGMWNFQINEISSKDKLTTELKVFELNAISSGAQIEPYEFDLIGSNSIFINSSFDLEMGAQKMNQVISKRISSEKDNTDGTELNTDASRLAGNLFSKKEDKLKVEMLKNDTDDKEKDTQTKDDKAAAKEAMLNIILGKAKFVPNSYLSDDSTIPKGIFKYLTLASYSDSTLFSLLKYDMDVKLIAANTVSPLLPINFSFTIHGISGINRGDMFKVNGIPTMYKNGFFQVLSVKHVINGMVWTTEVTGGYRNK